jgi:tetrahydromethanopterin S-methyltransferase subunit G
MDWLKDRLDYIVERLDELVGDYTDTRATVRGHGAALKWLFGIVASAILFLVAIVLGVR